MSQYKEDSLPNDEQVTQQQSDSESFKHNIDESPSLDKAEHEAVEVIAGESSAQSREGEAEQTRDAMDELASSEPELFEQAANHARTDEAVSLSEWDEVNMSEHDAAAEAESEELSRVIEELCLSKAEEFALLGYDSVTGKDIWEFVSEQYDKTGIPPLHRLINDILSLRVTDYMNWLTLSAYKGLKFTE